MDSIELMVAEHDNVLRLVNVIRNACCCVLEGAPVDVDDFRSIITFARTYADRHHHKKEEEILFREMLAQMGDMAINVIKNGMIIEHEMGRFRIMELERALDDFAQSKATLDKLAVITNAASWADLLQRHIERENNVVYPLARRSLSPACLKQVDEEAAAFEAAATAASVQTNALQLLATLEEKYC